MTSEPDPIERLRADVEALVACEGRSPGSAGGRAARAHLLARFGELGLEPVGEEGFLQPIPRLGAANLIGRIAGRGRPERHLVLAAHYDHLGRLGGRTYPGADDNASGVAVLLEAARRLGGAEPERSVLVCAFDAEEPPHFLGPDMGSIRFVERPTVPLQRIDAMVCLDIVGHPLGPHHLPEEVRSSVFCLGAERSPQLARLVAEQAEPGIRVRRLDAALIPPLSDYYAFAEAGVPFLFFTCGRDRHYHHPSDVPANLDYPKMAALAAYLAALAGEVGRLPEAPAYHPQARDDPATVGTLAAVARALGGRSVTTALALPAVAALELRVAGRRSLTAAERAALPVLVGTLEGALR